MSQGNLHPVVAAAAEIINRMERSQLQQLAGLLLGYVAGAEAEQLAKAELRLRSEHLAGQARPAGAYGRVVCPVCGKPKQQHALAEHIRRQHADHLAALKPNTSPRVAG